MTLLDFLSKCCLDQTIKLINSDLDIIILENEIENIKLAEVLKYLNYEVSFFSFEEDSILYVYIKEF